MRVPGLCNDAVMRHGYSHGHHDGEDLPASDPRAIAERRREAEEKLEQHQREAREKEAREHPKE
ncbi:hypothetical protein D477_013511 [Arthrobacter crystallopoietes BAB-32]|uniref:Uncharacterized protein n=2 Tax=Crystallibacter crystallopoietes TaxID=37928 RepID=N1UTE0_9MICC|nr:hypothetical protein D477_013511 [Arthrobacter crystallopoietes BAB-32]